MSTISDNFCWWVYSFTKKFTFRISREAQEAQETHERPREFHGWPKEAQCKFCKTLLNLNFGVKCKLTWNILIYRLILDVYLYSFTFFLLVIIKKFWNQFLLCCGVNFLRFFLRVKSKDNQFLLFRHFLRSKNVNS